MATVAYLRCSTDAQDTLRQHEAIERSGIKIDRWFEDHESRDKAHKRRDFQRLLQAVRAGQVDTIVVAALDRFGVKDAYEMGSFFTILRDHDCRLLDANGKHLNAEDDATVLTSTIGALTSTREQKEKSGRVLTSKVMLAREGHFMGGHVPYGTDIVCFDAQNKERWRCVYEGHEERVKVYPDGHKERFDGKGNVPPKAPRETLKFRPSIVAERIKYVKLIFKWFTTESISAGQIASRLNDLGVSTVYGPLWHQSVIKYMLTNPVYIGRPTYNKESGGRFMEFSGGQVRTAERKTDRPRDKADQISPDQDEFSPIVDPEVFEKARAKLAATKKRAYRAPKTACLWFKGFLVCSKCDKPMRAQFGNKRNGVAPGYICAEYGRWGSHAPSGCGHFRVEHDLIEAMVLDYLVEVAPQIKTLLDATEATDLEAARPLLDALSATERELNFTSFDMAVFAEKYLPSKARRKATKRMSDESIYDLLYKKVKPRIEKTIAEKEAELDALLDGFAGLSPKLIERANKRGEALQRDIDRLQRDLVDLRVPWEWLKTDLKARQEALQRATTILNQEGRFRQKAEALKTVVDRIVCYFSKSGRRCTLESIELYAAEDGAIRPLTFPGDSLQMNRRLRASA